MLLVFYNYIGTKLAPALQAAQAQLERAKVEDVLTKKIERRPSATALEHANILKGILNRNN